MNINYPVSNWLIALVGNLASTLAFIVILATLLYLLSYVWRQRRAIKAAPDQHWWPLLWRFSVFLFSFGLLTELQTSSPSNALDIEFSAEQERLQPKAEAEPPVVQNLEEDWRTPTDETSARLDGLIEAQRLSTVGEQGNERSSNED